MAEPLFVEEVVFLFHSRSKDAPPGHGVGELLKVPGDFAGLAATPDWRRKLSNFAEAPFELDGLRWKSVEHFFQASKFVRVAPAYYRSFSLDAGTDLGRAEGPSAKSAGGRRGHPLSPADIARWDSIKHDVMRRALHAKFAQNEDHRRILLATGLAKLTHRPLRAAHTIVEMELMEVRRELRNA